MNISYLQYEIAITDNLNNRFEEKSKPKIMRYLLFSIYEDMGAWKQNDDFKLLLASNSLSILRMGNQLNIDCQKNIEPSFYLPFSQEENELKEIYSHAIIKYAGHITKSLESMDHIEDIPLYTTMKNSIAAMFNEGIRVSDSLGFDLEKLIRDYRK